MTKQEIKAQKQKEKQARKIEKQKRKAEKKKKRALTPEEKKNRRKFMIKGTVTILVIFAVLSVFPILDHFDIF